MVSMLFVCYWLLECSLLFYRSDENGHRRLVCRHKIIVYRL
jgi:hypothetical protein